MKLLYLHGLESSLTEEKRKVLSKYFEVIAPSIDYKVENRIVESLLEEFSSEGIDVLIGSSMGGYAAYFLSLIMHIPVLAFNPALPYKNVVQFIPEINKKRVNYAKIIIGLKDNVIKADDNIDFLRNTVNPDDNIKITLINKLEHPIPIDIFEQEVEIFYNELKNEKT